MLLDSLLFYVHFSQRAFLLLGLQGRYNLNVGIKESVQTVCETFFLVWGQHVGGDGNIIVAFLETHICEVVDGHLNLRLRVFRFYELQDVFSGRLI